MNTAKFIPYTKDKVIVKTDKGSKLAKLTDLSVKFYGDLPLAKDEITNEEIVNNLSSVSELHEGIAALLDGIDGALTRFMNFTLEEADEYEKEEIRKIFKLLDYAKSELEKASIITSATNYRISI